MSIDLIKELEPHLNEFYGIKLWEHPDDWGWTILGWHDDKRRIIAAIHALCRDYGVEKDLRDSIMILEDFEISRKIAVNIREAEEHEEGAFVWDWADEAFTGAGPRMTVVTI